MSSSTVEQYSPEFIAHNRVIKLSETDATVTIGVAGSPDPGELSSVRSRLERFHGKPLRLRTIDPKEIVIYLGRTLGGRNKVGGDGGTSDPAAPDGRTSPRDEFQLDVPAPDAPAITRVNTLLLDALRNKASDVHIDCFEHGARIRQRIDGQLKWTDSLSKAESDSAVSRIKIMSRLDIVDHRTPQEGRCRVAIGREAADVRVSTIPTSSGESVVLRLLAESVKFPNPKLLGFNREMTRAIQAVVRASHGLYLFAGPTGSGKTTTLHSVLNAMDTTRRKAITIEDPVEYTLDQLPQVQVNESTGFGYGLLLKRVLRQDPDVVMIGEIRDATTGISAVRAAMSGHLILSTVHAERASDVVDRLVAIGVPRTQLLSVLRTVFAQRLVRRVCSVCRRYIPPDTSEQRIFSQARVTARLVPVADGCASCNMTGYDGRFGIGEFRTYERSESPDNHDPRSRSLNVDGLSRVAEGQTTLDEVLRETTW